MNKHDPSDDEMMGSTACFTGHRIIAGIERAAISQLLEKTVADAYKKGYRRFFCGAAIGFDMLAAKVIINMRKNWPEISLILAVPCSEQSEKWSYKDRQEWINICSNADRVDILSDFYYRGCMEVRNRYMVDRSSLCICWMKTVSRGGTVQTVHYALEKGLTVVNLAMMS